MFKHSADRIPVLCILALTALDFALFFFVESITFLFCYFLLMIIPKGHICAWNHHHQHTPTFRLKPLNRLLEFFYALHTGVTTNLWLLHHVYGHHLNFLDQTKDESRWVRDDGSKMGEIEYTLVLFDPDGSAGGAAARPMVELMAVSITDASELLMLTPV